MTTKPKNHGASKHRQTHLSNNLSIINSHQTNKDNNKALKAIAIIESVYASKEVFDQELLDFLDLLDTGQLDKIITREIKNNNDYESFAHLYFKGIYSAIHMTSVLISTLLPEHKGWSKKCTDVKYADDVVILEFDNYKLTLLKYEDKFRLLHLHNRTTKKTTLFKESFFDTSAEIFTYMNNIEEYAEFNGDVLEMIKY